MTSIADGVPVGPAASVRRSNHSVPAGVFICAAAVTAVLLVVAGRYGFHRDEYYFVVTGQHPAWAAPDNPMLVPYLAAGWYALVGGHLWAFRILPALAVGVYVLLGGLIAREIGARRRHQVAAAGAVALTGIVLAVGHLFETTTFDMVVTAAALWMLIRALGDGRRRWGAWIWFGVLTGVAMEIKIMAAPVMACCLIGIVIFGPRRRLADPRPWVAAAVAVILAAPNLIWQASHGWPMATIAAGIAGGDSTSSSSRVALLPTMLLEIGPIVCVVLIVGVVRALRAPLRRDGLGWLAAGFLVFVALMLVTGGKAYYPAGFYPALMAIGAGPVLDWSLLRRWRRVLAVSLISISILVTASLTLPLYPVGSVLFRIGTGPNPDMAETVGWDQYVTTVADVARSLPADQRAQTIVTASNYGEAGSLYLARQAGGADGRVLPPVYSGSNAFWYWGPPPESATNAIVVGSVPPEQLARFFTSCTLRARLTSPAGVDNDEADAPVRFCTGRTASWAAVWPRVNSL
jgi:hypothetical protein